MSDIDWNKSGEEAIAEFKKGDQVKVKVLDVDVEKERISLGIKQLSSDPFESAAAGMKKGDVVTTTVTAITDGGIEVAVADGFSGFIRKSDLSRERSEQRPDRFAVGEKVDAKVTQVDRGGRRISLSIKAQGSRRREAGHAGIRVLGLGASLGDILGAALRRAQSKEQSED